MASQGGQITRGFQHWQDMAECKNAFLYANGIGIRSVEKCPMSFWCIQGSSTPSWAFQPNHIGCAILPCVPIMEIVIEELESYWFKWMESGPGTRLPPPPQVSMDDITTVASKDKWVEEVMVDWKTWSGDVRCALRQIHEERESYTVKLHGWSKDKSNSLAATGILHALVSHWIFVYELVTPIHVSGQHRSGAYCAIRFMSEAATNLGRNPSRLG